MKQLAETQKTDMLRYIDTRFNSAQKAVDEYNNTNNERWVGANEFRGQLKDQAGTFMTRRELWLAVIAIIGVIVAVVTLILK